MHLPILPLTFGFISRTPKSTTYAYDQNSEAAFLLAAYGDLCTYDCQKTVAHAPRTDQRWTININFKLSQPLEHPNFGPLIYRDLWMIMANRYLKLICIIPTATITSIHLVNVFLDIWVLPYDISQVSWPITDCRLSAKSLRLYAFFF